jgi:hypothetical protein
VKLGLCASAFAVLSLFAPSRVQAETLIRLNLPEDYSKLTVREFKAELGRIVEDADLDVQWESGSSEVRTVDGQTISVSLLGSCAGMPSQSRQSGPLGWTKSIDSRVLPYIEISCARVGALLAPAWRDEPAVQRDLFFGRALARVLAHELAHALTRTTHHSEEGLRKRALSPRDLITGSYRMARSDFERPKPEPRLEVASTRKEAPEAFTVVDGGGR